MSRRGIEWQRTESRPRDFLIRSRDVPGPRIRSADACCPGCYLWVSPWRRDPCPQASCASPDQNIRAAPATPLRDNTIRVYLHEYKISSPLSKSEFLDHNLPEGAKDRDGPLPGPVIRFRSEIPISCALRSAEKTLTSRGTCLSGIRPQWKQSARYPVGSILTGR